MQYRDGALTAELLEWSCKRCGSPIFGPLENKPLPVDVHFSQQLKLEPFDGVDDRANLHWTSALSGNIDTLVPSRGTRYSDGDTSATLELS